jgi:hypothetical protein
VSDMTEATAALYLLATQLDGIEDLRTATSNRLRQATRSTADSDGEVRGLGLSESDPEVAAVLSTSKALEEIEHQAILSLQRAMRKHPLGPWQKAQIGVGEKQLARLLAAIGDPYWNTLYDRPRTVSELWAYCGLHTLPVSGQMTTDTHMWLARDENQPPSGTPDHPRSDPQSSPVRGAARRKKGQRANWSTDAKTRAYLIAESCVKQARSPYRAVYDARRAATAERVHDRPCPQCNGAGKTELIASPWRPGHQHADALRIVSKTVLRDLWVAARDWHGARP